MIIQKNCLSKKETMKVNRYLSILMVVIIFMINCEEGSNNELGENPIIDAVNSNYISEDGEVFLSVETDDPQGYEDVETVNYTMYYTAEDDSVEVLLSNGTLVDDGTEGDIITSDGAFSRKFYSMAKGTYRFEAEAFDSDNNSSDIGRDTLRALDNEAPEIYMFSYPESFEKGDTITFEVKVTDPDGLDDIFSVKLQIERPDGTMIDYIWDLKDDGDTVWGDETTGDGIYSIKFPTNQASKYHGLWKFYFQATDKDKEESNQESVTVKNPGLAVIYPDSSESFNSGDLIEIEWDSIFIDTVVVQYTADADAADPVFIDLTEKVSYDTTYQWTIPTDLKSEKCKIYIFDKENETRYDFSDDYFEVK